MGEECGACLFVEALLERNLPLWTGADFFIFAEAEVGEAQFGLWLFSRHRSDQFDPQFCGLLMVFSTSVSSVRQGFFGRKSELLCALNGGKQGSGIMLSGRLDGDMSDQGKRGFIFSSAVGFGDLNLIALPLVAIVAGIGVRRVLQGIAGNLLVGATRDLFAVT